MQCYCTIPQEVCQGFYGLFSLPLHGSIMSDGMAHSTFSVNSTVMTVITHKILKYELYLPQIKLHLKQRYGGQEEAAICP